MFITTNDGSVVDETGKILFFSLERFIQDICQGNHCFICGISPSEAPFNDEHILPNWILRRQNLFSRKVTLPNHTGFRYDQYKIPCCADCNSLLGEKIEKPVSEMIAQGHKGVSDYVSKNGIWLFFVWLSLIFFKTHIKDKNLRYHKDLREGDEKIFDLYTWEDLHHIHCVVRSSYTGANLSPNVLGSFLTLPAKVNENLVEDCDYADLHKSQVMLLRIGDVAFVTALNDSCGVLNVFHESFLKDRNIGWLYPIQLREILARFAHINLLLKERPSFYTDFDPKLVNQTINGTVPSDVSLNDPKSISYGDILLALTEDIFSQSSNLSTNAKKESLETLKRNVKEGIYSWLFNEKGEFIDQSKFHE